MTTNLTRCTGHTVTDTHTDRQTDRPSCRVDPPFGGSTEKISDLEALVEVKDRLIAKLVNKIDKMVENQNVNLDNAIAAKGTDNVTEVVNDKMIHSKVEVREKENAPKVSNDKIKQKSKPKCKFEDTGKCKLKKNCPYFHPKRTCQSHGKLGTCYNKLIYA